MIEISAKTLEEAIKEAAIKLNTTVDNINYEVIEEGAKGFLGFGSKNFKIRANVLKLSTNEDRGDVEQNYKTANAEKVFNLPSKEEFESIEEELAKFLKELTLNMNVSAEIEIKSEDDRIYVDFKGDDLSILIGRHGATLDSIQYLANVVANKNRSSYVKVQLNVADYREKRKEALEVLAERLGNKVKRTKRAVILEPMSPNERRIIHSYLHSMVGVGTRSEGDEPYRKVIIFPDNRRNKNN